MPPGTYQRALGERLRAIRTQQGLSLAAVAEKSGGRWNPAVLGSYERADRALTIERLAGLAEFYGVPMSVLLPAAAGRRHTASDGSRLDEERLDGKPPRLVLSLPGLQEAPPEADPVRRFAREICSQRGDWNGSVLSLRSGDGGGDLRLIAILLDVDEAAALGQLATWGALAAGSITPSGAQ